MDIDKTFEELYEGWKLEKEARTYKDRVDDDEKKKKKHFAFGGKKKSRHGESGYGKGEEMDREFAEAFGLDERKMTDGEKEEREEIVKKLKPKLQSFKDRYGDDAKKVMYATATKQAMEEFKLGEGWKKGKYKVTDGKTGKVLATFNSGGKAQKYVDDIFQKGDYESLTVELDEENKYEMFDDKPARELDKEMKKAMKMKSYEVARAHIGDFLIKLDKKYPKSGAADTEPRSIATDMLNKKFGTKHKLHYADSSDELKFMKSKPGKPLNIMRSEEFALEEAFSMRKGDKRVVDAFYDQKEIKAHGASILTTDGKTLTKTGMGGQDIAKWVNGKIKIVAVSDVKSTEQILRYMKKSIPSGVFEEIGNVAPTAPDSGGIQYQAPVLGQKKKKKKQTIDEAVKRTTFAGKDVFIVDSETYYNCRLGKKKYGRYEKYVGNGKVGQTIREYGLKYPRRPIILQNGESGPMLFLKYGRS